MHSSDDWTVGDKIADLMVRPSMAQILHFPKCQPLPIESNPLVVYKEYLYKAMRTKQTEARHLAFTNQLLKKSTQGFLFRVIYLQTHDRSNNYIGT